MKTDITRRGFLKKASLVLGGFIITTILLKPPQLESIVYHSKEDNLFIAHSIECDQLGCGDTKQEAIEDLGNGLKNLYNLYNREENLAFYRNAPPKIQDALKKAKNSPDKYISIVHEVPGYFKISNYDFTKENFSLS